MKALQYLCFAFLFTSISIFSQTNYVYQEEFNSDNGWPIGNYTNYNLSRYNGRLYFEHKRTENSQKITTRTFSLNSFSDFEMETSFQKISGVDNVGMTFMYDYKDNNNYRELGITANGYFRVAETVNGTYKNIKSWTKSSNVKTGNYAVNKLKVAKKGNTISYYVNGSYVYSMTHKSFMGKKIAITLYKNQKISIDYIRVKQGSSTIKTIARSETILFEGYNNNNNNWPTKNDGNAYLAVKNGDYEFEHFRSSGGWNTSIEKYINSSRDFSITAQIKKRSGITNNGYGILFGRKDNDNQNQFFISGTGSYIIRKYDNGKSTYIKNWTKSSAIKEGNGVTNYLKVEKRGSAYKYFINDVLVHTSYSMKLYGNRVGYIIYGQQKIAVGYLSLKYLDGKKKTNPNINTLDNISNYTYNNSAYHFSDQFNSNSNNWSTKSDNLIDFKIKNGKYYLKHKRKEKGWSCYIDKYIDTSRDFEIETKIDKISGVTNYAYGLIFGKKDSNDFRFYISSGGYYKVVRNINGKEEIIQKWTKSSLIKTGNLKSNTLKVKKENDYYKFYINTSYVYQTEYEDFFGNDLGFVVFNDQQIAIDYVRVKYLGSKTNIVTKNTDLNLPLNDQFSFNTNNWYLENIKDYSVDMNNSKLLIHRKTKGGIFISKNVNINTAKDFIIETALSHTNTSSGYYGLTFGRKNSSNEFSFLLSGNGSYKFRKFDNNKYQEIIQSTFSSAIKTGNNQTNILKIVKSGGLLRFYINNQYINETPFESFYGKKLGYTVYYDRKIAIDYLNIKYQTEIFNSPPTIVVNEPKVQRGFKIVKTKRILVKGLATDSDGIFEVEVNGVEANVSSDGSFTANVPLKYGENTLIVSATDLKQSKSTKQFQIIRESPKIDETTSDKVIAKKDEVLDVGFGKYYALIIGVSEYDDPKVADLEGEPTKDAQALADVLTTNYNFERSNIKVLKNPTATQIKKEFVLLRKKVTKNDNVLIFYAGHGNYNEQMEYGYWMPSNVEMEFESNIVLNTEIVTYLRTIKSKNTLLISDACFSGSILVKSRAYSDASKAVQIKHDTESRKAITSGTLTTVPNKSIFMKYLLRFLKENKQPYLSAMDLYHKIEVPIINNSPGKNPPKPVYAPISQTGDMGGDFYFIKRN